jgi:hypothetical protein
MVMVYNAPDLPELFGQVERHADAVRLRLERR